MTKNYLGIEVPAGTDAFDPAGDMTELGASLAGRVIVPVANTTARDLLATQVPPSTGQPLIVYRADADVFERNVGSGWRTMTPPRGAVATSGGITLNPGAWAPMVSIASYPVVAGADYMIGGTGSVSIGGAKAVVSHSFKLGAVESTGVAFDIPVSTFTPLGGSVVLTAAVTGNVAVSWQALANAPATGLVVIAGTSVSIGRIS